MRFDPASCSRCRGGRSTAVNSRLARPPTEERFDRLAKRKKALGMFFYRRGWSMISGCGNRSPPTLHPIPSFSPTPTVDSWIRELPEPNPDSAGQKTWITETELPGLAQNDGNAGAGQGIGEGHPKLTCGTPRPTPQPTSICRSCRKVLV